MIILMNRVITVHNKKTSMRLTNAEWNILENVCGRENIKRKNLLEQIEQKHSPDLNLTSAVRLFLQLYLYEIVRNTKDSCVTAADILQQTLNNIN